MRKKKGFTIVERAILAVPAFSEGKEKTRRPSRTSWTKSKYTSQLRPSDFAICDSFWALARADKRR